MVSCWKEQCGEEQFCFEDAFELFCEGVSPFGPYWDHLLGYWKVSMNSPEKVLFLKYEELKINTLFYVKKMAEFMGYSFSLDEEVKSMVQKIVDLASLRVWAIWRWIKMEGFVFLLL